MIVYLEKKPYYTIKKLILQSDHIGLVSKEVPYDCDQKLEITPWFVLGQE